MNSQFRSIGTKIMTITLSASAVMLLTAFYVFFIARGTAAAFEHTAKVQIANERAILQLVASFKTQVQEWKNFLLRGADAEQLNKYWFAFEKEEAAIQASGKALLDNIEDTASRQAVSAFLNEHLTMGASYRKGKQAFTENGFSPIAGDKAVKGMDRKPTELLQHAAEVIRHDGQQAIDEATTSARRNTLLALIVLIGAIGASLLTTLLALRAKVMRPTALLVDDLNRLGQGDFSREITFSSNDEMGLIAGSARQMQQRLGALIGQLGSTITLLGGAAQEMTNITARANESVAEQYGQADQVATATNEMAATVQDVARSAEQAAVAAEKSDKDARSGHDVVQRTVASITQLADDITNASAVIAQLKNDSDSIGSVIDVIRGIAEQTNLLALNAAIEAARAGEQGRGFAVVADEVRTLASRTQKSTQEIHSMIEQLQSRTSNAVRVMTESSTRVRNTVSQANEAAVSLDAITRSVTLIHEMNAQIASAAEEQGAVAAEINSNVLHIRDGVGFTAENATRTAGISKTLQDLSSTMESAMQEFRVKQKN